eukprot:1283956-Rhodomonas_salina.1
MNRTLKLVIVFLAMSSAAVFFLARIDSRSRALPKFEIRAPLPPQAEAPMLPCRGGTNRARPRLCDCPGVDANHRCLTFTCRCNSPMTADCEHMRQRMNGTDSAAAVVVTAFWNLRPDIEVQDWSNWLSQ